MGQVLQRNDEILEVENFRTFQTESVSSLHVIDFGTVRAVYVEFGRR